MNNSRGFVLIETVIIVFLVGMIALAISNIVYNNNKNMAYLRAYMYVDEVLSKEAYRAKVGLESEHYDNLKVEKTSYFVEDCLSIKGLTLEYVDISVSYAKYDTKKKTTIVRRGN